MKNRGDIKIKKNSCPIITLSLKKILEHPISCSVDISELLVLIFAYVYPLHEA